MTRVENCQWYMYVYVLYTYTYITWTHTLKQKGKMANNLNITLQKKIT